LRRFGDRDGMHAPVAEVPLSPRLGSYRNGQVRIAIDDSRGFSTGNYERAVAPEVGVGEEDETRSAYLHEVLQPIGNKAEVRSTEDQRRKD